MRRIMTVIVVLMLSSTTWADDSLYKMTSLGELEEGAVAWKAVNEQKFNENIRLIDVMLAAKYTGQIVAMADEMVYGMRAKIDNVTELELVRSVTEQLFPLPEGSAHNLRGMDILKSIIVFTYPPNPNAPPKKTYKKVKIMSLDRPQAAPPRKTEPVPTTPPTGEK
jgi:hypothetical protein